MSRIAEARAALAEHRAEQSTRAPSLFDPPVDEPVTSPMMAALVAVENNASSQWNEHALEAVKRAAHIHAVFTVEQVHPFITEPVHDSRALGPVMRRAAKLGFIERIPDAYRISKRPESHARPLALWRSRIGDIG